MLNLMNTALGDKNNKLSQQYTDETWPIYFIIAQPRGVSTLFQQLITSNLEIAYINNFLAKFYKAPLFGIELEKDIIDKQYKSTYISNYGNTNGIDEPHEWGWFWKNILNLENNEHYSKIDDFSQLKNHLLSITNSKKLPLLLDNVYAMANILRFKELFQNIKIISLTRNLYFICNSIINARLSRYNDINVFYGHPPKNIRELLNIKNPIEQIVLQVKSIDNEIKNITNAFQQKDILEIDYEDIYNETYGVVENFHNFVKKDKFDLKFKKKHLPELSYRNNRKLINPKYKKDLDFYYDKHMGGGSQ